MTTLDTPSASVPVPTWTETGDTAPGSATVAVDLPEHLHRMLGAQSLDPHAVLLAVHARVIAALTGETGVVVGVLAPGGQVRPVSLDLDVASWAALLASIDNIREEPARAVETAVGADDGAPLPAGLRCTVAWTPTGLLVRYRLDSFDADAAERIAGYHTAAVRALLDDPDSAPLGRSVVGPDERAHQLRDMAGPARPLPDVRLHQLIEQQAHRHPDVIAAEFGEQQLTYGELNDRGNRIARVLLTRGLQPEDVVAVACARDLDWLASVLAVFKAGGTYLPVEPQFPPGRIAAMLARSQCRLALTTPHTRTNLDAAQPAGAVLTVGDALAESSDGTDPDLDIAAGRRAYIYFTSGSTGEPKGAMCEHAGMLNHVLAKIEDLGIGADDRVAQVAPQCFDISLWQLVAALVVGGRTVLVPSDTILDVNRMLTLLDDARVAVVQVVPSYLEVLITELERRPRPLAHLRAVSVTGEAVKHELVERWFGVAPGVAVLNAYGLTETSDDTNHELMRATPAGARVPLGAPVRNVSVYVVDERLEPVPLGAPGEVVFSGVCVGRGYINDPERTAAAFVADPHVPGARLYRSGDFGRWRPDGKLEFLGRRDTQLKISGFRIEIGEIENTLLRAPGVRDSCVVVAERSGARHLVGFYDADAPLADHDLRARLGAALPHYMVPTELHHRHPLPLSGNGKVDRNALTALAAELAPLAESRAPATLAQRRVAAAWARALATGADTFGVDDDFFAIGGTSLSAVKVVIALDRAVTVRDVTTLRTLRLLAEHLDAAHTAPALPEPAPADAADPQPRSEP